LVVILVLALLGGAGWWLLAGDASRALHVTVAVLVASCPCGIGVAFPLIEEMAVAAMRRHGVFVRDLSLFPRLRSIRRAVFDKTGTLTLETPVLANPGALTALEPVAISRLRQLVLDNPHPVARAVLESLAWNCQPETADAPPVSEAPPREEVVGQGVRLRLADGIWALGRPGFAGTDEAPEARDSDACFSHNGRILARLHFVETARSDARAEIAALRAESREVYILSGDRPEKVASLASALAIPAGQALGGLTPEEKRDWVLSHDKQDTLMLGDGANDSLAFDAAFARGTPVIHRGMLERKCDFYYLGRGLRGVRRLFGVAEIRRRALRCVFIFSVCYNLGTVTLALSGHVNPLVAAVVMPVSSILSLSLATISMRSAFRSS
jgi:Cu2+-exporting ATPase